MICPWDLWCHGIVNMWCCECISCWLSFLLCRRNPSLVECSLYQFCCLYVFLQVNPSLLWVVLPLLRVFWFCWGVWLVLWFFLVFMLGNHKYSRDNRILKLLVFNIMLAGRKSAGKRKWFFPLPVRRDIKVSPFLGWWSKITLTNVLSNLSCQLEYLQRILVVGLGLLFALSSLF